MPTWKDWLDQITNTPPNQVLVEREAIVKEFGGYLPAYKRMVDSNSTATYIRFRVWQEEEGDPLEFELHKNELMEKALAEVLETLPGKEELESAILNSS